MSNRSERTGRLAAWLFVLACAGCGRGGKAGGVPAPPARLAPPRPAGCREVSAGTSLQPLLDAAAPGSALCLQPGSYPGPLKVGEGVTLWGPPDAVVRSAGQGTTVRLTGQGPALLGLTVAGSGHRYDLADAAVHVEGTGARVEGVAVREALFGILVEKARGASVRGNAVQGTPETTLGLRGDGIRLWETTDTVVEGNTVLDSRDVVVWYSSRNRIVGNHVEGGRYGTHFMYSHGNEVLRNRYVHDVVGVFVMFARGITLEGNLVAGSGGAAGMGLGLKEAGEVVVRDNLFLHHDVGVYIDTSPDQEADHNLFERNVFRLCRAGVVFHGPGRRTTFRGNGFVDNQRQVEVDGGADALGTVWEHNAFDDYAGYDLDGDGLGDVPYEVRSLSGELTGQHPNIEFFRGAPALALVDALSQIAPLFAPHLLLADPHPALAPPRPELPDAP